MQNLLYKSTRQYKFFSSRFRAILFQFHLIGTCRRGFSFSIESGHVYYVATPLGNLGDITLRALEVLKGVDIICAEDTRHSINLLRHFSINDKKFLSHHEHNWSKQIPILVEHALSGKSLAVISDAGTPGISDPGYELAAACIASGVTLHPIPGPSAVVAALSVCGFPSSEFSFFGFLPVKGKERHHKLERMLEYSQTAVFYEAPHRILQTLQDIERIQSDRGCVCCKEITKIHEQFYRGTVSSCRKWLEDMSHPSESSVDTVSLTLSFLP